MPKHFVLILLLAFLGTVLFACTSPTVAPTTEVQDSPTEIEQVVEPTPIIPSPAVEPTETSVPTATTTATITPTPTPTKVPFEGFSKDFDLYRIWVTDGQTYIYFLQANFTGTIYGRADEYELVCNPDPKYPRHMLCVSEQEISDKLMMKFDFFTDEARKDLVYTHEYQTGLVSDVIYDGTNNCPQRGQDVHCESEYRLYDGRCYYAHTCYDACGYYYSRDNLPEVWTEFQGYTSPCD